MPCHSRKKLCVSHLRFEGQILMNRILSARCSRMFLFPCLALVSLCVAPVVALAQDTAAVTLTQVSSDPFTVGPGQHATEVEPHTLANGSTLVAAFQTGRISPGGSTGTG